MQDIKIRLQQAFDRGWVPNDITESMNARGHVGRVWVVENDDEDRVGVGYKYKNSDGSEQNQIHWYSKEEVNELISQDLI